MTRWEEQIRETQAQVQARHPEFARFNDLLPENERAAIEARRDEILAEQGRQDPDSRRSSSVR